MTRFKKVNLKLLNYICTIYHIAMLNCGRGSLSRVCDPLNPMESPCVAGEIPWKPRFSQTWCPSRWNYDTALPHIASPQRSKVRAIPGPGPDDPNRSDPLAAYLSVANLVWTGSYGEWPTLYGVNGCKWSIRSTLKCSKVLGVQGAENKLSII